MPVRRTIRWVGARVERPIDVAEVLKNLAAILLVVAVVISLRIALDERGESRTLRQELELRDETAECRRGLAVAVSEAEVSYLLAIGRLIEPLPQERGPERDAAIDAALLELSRTADELDDARDARADFELNPEPCPNGRIRR